MMDKHTHTNKISDVQNICGCIGGADGDIVIKHSKIMGWI